MTRPGRSPPNECADAVNVDFFRSRCGTKRPGTRDMTAGISAVRRLPGNCRHSSGMCLDRIPRTAELWARGRRYATPIINRLRLVSFSRWAAPTLFDGPTGNGWEFSAASANGLLALAYKTARKPAALLGSASRRSRRGGLRVRCRRAGGGEHGRGALCARSCAITGERSTGASGWRHGAPLRAVTRRCRLRLLVVGPRRASHSARRLPKARRTGKWKRPRTALTSLSHRDGAHRHDHV